MTEDQQDFLSVTIKDQSMNLINSHFSILLYSSNGLGWGGIDYEVDYNQMSHHTPHP